ncbi:extracellular solute-binding protein [Jidongwangia harbinensis]|uniref:extracellular solute-binding protein n=1 Tax=Jidongwangia harbinensis TaxID=2878561 RepID=UPI001CDA5574|nr:extracellular solute-binding protein [Jidongwangia harbinensis]MCA2217931.1 extracellular solute-binding protein [Jidongwangia harbinensis]
MSPRLPSRVPDAWSWIRARPGRSGLVAGGAAGLVTGLLLALMVVPRLDGDQAWEPGELVILSSVDESQGGQRQRLLDQWNAMHGERNPASIRPVSRSPETAHTEMLSAGPEIDIYNLDVTWTAEFVAGDRIRPLDKAGIERRGLYSGFLEEPRSTCEYRGTLYALPFNTDAGLLYYRTYPRGNTTWPPPPTNWDDIRNATDQALGTAVDTKLEAGYAAQLSNSEILTVTALEAIWAEGGEVVDNGGAVVFDSDKAERGLRRLKDGLDGGARPLILPDSRTFDEKTSTKAFGDGRAMFMRNWPVAYRDLRPDVESDKDFTFGVTTVPGKRSVLGGQNLAVARSSDQPRAAQALIEFLTGERSQQILFEHGGFAATRGIVYQDANITTKYPYATTLLEAIRRAEKRPVTPHYTTFSLEFRKVVTDVWANDGEITAEHARRLSEALQGKSGG